MSRTYPFGLFRARSSPSLCLALAILAVASGCAAKVTNTYTSDSPIADERRLSAGGEQTANASPRAAAASTAAVQSKPVSPTTTSLPEGVDCPADAVYCLDPSLSRIAFTAMKNGTVATPGYFKEIAGVVVKGGDGLYSGRFSAKNGSVDSGNVLRDQRMMDAFFKATPFPESDFKFRIPTTLPDSWMGTIEFPVEGEFSVGPLALNKSFKLEARKIPGDRIVVVPVDAVSLSIAELGKSSDLVEYLAMCGARVEDTVTVDFTLTLEPNKK